MTITPKERTAEVQALAHDTIVAERAEMHAAIIHMVEVLALHCADVTAVVLEESDQGEWLDYLMARCASHDEATCPANADAARDEAYQFAPHVYISQLGHLVDEFGCQRPDDAASLASITIPLTAYAALKEAGQ